MTTLDGELATCASSPCRSVGSMEHTGGTEIFRSAAPLSLYGGAFT